MSPLNPMLGMQNLFLTIIKYLMREERSNKQTKHKIKKKLQKRKEKI